MGSWEVQKRYYLSRRVGRLMSASIRSGSELNGEDDAKGPGCVKSRTDAMICFLNRQAGATDVRLCGRD